MVVVGKHVLGTLVDDNDGKTDVLREKVTSLSLGPPQISHGVACYWLWVSII